MDFTSASQTTSLLCASAAEPCRFIAELTDLRKEVDLLKQQVRTDALTGLYNFRFFSDTLPLEMERARRAFQPLSMIILDIDHFKNFNDRWGHEIGNHALIHIANLINQTVRKLDYACRFGGEEFVIILPNTDLRRAVCVANRLREMIETSPLMKDGQVTVPITASLGVDEFRTHQSDTAQGFVERVDSWLYSAKHSGRNRVLHPDISESKTSVTYQEKNALFGSLDVDEQ